MGRRLGYIYFLKTASEAAIKVGYSGEHPGKRIANIQTSNYELLVLHGYIRGTLKREASLHARLAKHRIRGEWFRCCHEVMRIIDATIARNPLPAPESLPRPEPMIEPEPQEVEPALPPGSCRYLLTVRDQYDADRTRELWSLGDMVAESGRLSAADVRNHYVCRERHYAPRGMHPEFVFADPGEMT